MAQGSVIWRCRRCGNRTDGACKHPRGRYYIVYWVGKRQRWEAVSRIRKDAERRLIDVQSQLYAGTYRRVQPITFSVFAEQWLRDYAAGAVKPLTLRRYRSLVHTHLVPAFGHVPLTTLTPEDVQRFMARALRAQTAAPRTINHALVVLKGMLKHARQWGYLRQNPAEEIKHARVEPQEMDYLRPEEIRLLIDHADEPYRTLFLTAILTGMRRAELLALQWGDIDWRSHTIYVRRGIFWPLRVEVEEPDRLDTLWQFTTPKTQRSMRTVVMSPRLQEALELHRIGCPVSPWDLVFCTSRGTPIEPRNLIRREFEPALTRAGLRRIRFHDLRYTYTTLLIAQGAHVKFIQSQLGHASVQMTLDRYGHLLPETQHMVGAKLDAQVFGDSEGAEEKRVKSTSRDGAGLSGSHAGSSGIGERSETYSTRHSTVAVALV